MQYTGNGIGIFNNIPDLYYELFIEMGLAVRSDQYLYDQDTGAMLQFGEKFIKASTDGSPIYNGKNDILFEPRDNYSLMSMLFGYYLDKCQNDEDNGDILGGYIAHYIDDDANREKQRVVVKTHNRGEIASNYYWCIYLAYIDAVFAISGYNVDLSNFDIKPEFDKDGRRIMRY